MEKEYPVEGEEIFIVPDKEFDENLKKYGLSKYIGGYCFSETKKIYIRESRKHDVKLINHERGHLRKYNHKWNLKLMCPTWVFRWFNRY